jgi:hypothetical protein
MDIPQFSIRSWCSWASRLEFLRVVPDLTSDCPHWPFEQAAKCERYTDGCDGAPQPQISNSAQEQLLISRRAKSMTLWTLVQVLSC